MIFRLSSRLFCALVRKITGRLHSPLSPTYSHLASPFTPQSPFTPWLSTSKSDTSSCFCLSHTTRTTRLTLLVITELALLVLGFCMTFISNMWFKYLSSPTVFKATALDNALFIVSTERTMGIYVEREMQLWASETLNQRGWWAWNTYYAGIHTLVTVAVMVVLLLRMMWATIQDDINQAHAIRTRSTIPPRNSTRAQRDYNALRTIFVASSVFAAFGYLFLPVMPPRLLSECGIMQGASVSQGACLTAQFDFVDTIRTYGNALWKWEDVASSANPYAAFPSVHTLWSTFVAVAWIRAGPQNQSIATRTISHATSTPCHHYSLWKIFTRFLRKYWVIMYPMVTVYCIIITGNHFILDAIGGLILLMCTWLVQRAFECRRLSRREIVQSQHDGEHVPERPLAERTHEHDNVPREWPQRHNSVFNISGSRAGVVGNTEREMEEGYELLRAVKSDTELTDGIDGIHMSASVDRAFG